MYSATSLVLQYFIVCTSIYYVFSLYKRRRFFRFAWNNNGFFVPVLPIVGTSYLLLIACFFNGFKLTTISILKMIKNVFGYPANLWIGGTYYYLTNNPEDIRIILNHPKCYDKGIIYDPINHISNNALFLAPLTSAGLQQENLSSELEQFGDLISRMQDNLKPILLFPFIPHNFWIRFFPRGRQLADDIKKIKTIVSRLIEQKRVQPFNTKDVINSDKTIPFLDLVIHGGHSNEIDIFGEITFFTAAATDTTASSLSFCFTLLGMHPIIQETLYNEIMDQLGFSDISSDDLPNLKYSEAVILETLRLFPVVPVIVRRAGADLELGTKVIPKETNIVIDILQLHRDQKYWSNPLQFDPDRFLSKNSDESKYAFLPFSAGHRDCLGKAQAMALMKTTVATVIRKFKVTSKYQSVNDFILTSCLSMRTIRPLECQFTLRQEK